MNTMRLDIFGSRLRSARMIAGLSLRELSEKIDNEVTKQSLSKYENGLMQPSSEVLFSLSEALNLKVDFFLKNNFVEFKSVDFRKKRSLSKKDEEAILEKARLYYENYSEIENILGIGNSFHNPIEDLLIQNFDDIERAAEVLRESWELGSQPISNLIEMLESVGIKVYTIEHGEDIDGVAIEVEGGSPLVIINTANKPLERLRFTIIHELGHSLLKFTQAILDDERLMEKMCHYFASCFLIPKSKLIEMIGGVKRTYIKINELIAIKEYFGISIRALVYRLQQIEIINTNYHKRWSIWLNNTYGSKNEPGNYVGIEKSYRFMQLIDRALSEELISVSKAAGLSNLSVSDIKRMQPIG
ncbi:MAG: DNA-binding protein [Flavobacteriaceae bacterium CG17_big_fil_post_rev_8_21_14_2_50_33_15]|nr:MAG: DNA-binding protein [Flavobacteriaceae bacterium CG17_big_fil_post_rev_8_21_14_2_50_33_15]